MPNYNTILQNYNTRLQGLIDTANSLPEAGAVAEDLDTELDAQSAKLNQLLSVLDTKASGGARVSVPLKDYNF